MADTGSAPADLLTIDLAFDWDSNSKGGYDGFCLIGPSGFAMAVPGNPPTGSRRLTTADQLQFAIYDISDQAATRSLTDLVIKVRAAHDANTEEFPFEPAEMGKKDGHGWYPIADLDPGDRLTEGYSKVYGGPYSMWAVRPTPLNLVTVGWYFFKASFKVSQAGAKSKTFGNDPEMIVGPGT